MPARAAIAASVILAACGGAPSANTETDAPTGFEIELTPVAEGLEFPWSMVFLPNGDMLVTEREGRLRVIRDGALDPAPVSGTPKAYVERQGGYLGLALDPDFDTNRRLYLAYSAGTDDANRTTVVRGTLSANASAFENVETIFEATPRDTALHFGGRLAFLGDGTLLVTLGDGFRYLDEAQNTANTHGKIIRINADGSIPEDNPFAGDPSTVPGLYTYGHRNVQGLFYDGASGVVYAHEHGPKGGDEINILEPGDNYGWPEITYGVNYNGTIISDEVARDGMEQPIVKWVPSIAPSGMTKYTGDYYPGWRGDLFIGAMNGPAGLKLVRVDLDETGAVRGEEALLADAGFGFRDVAEGPDGRLYVATSDLDGAIYRLDRKGAES